MILFHENAARSRLPANYLIRDAGEVVTGLMVPVPAASRDSRVARGYAPAQSGMSALASECEVYPVTDGVITSFPDGSPIPKGAEPYIVPKLEQRLTDAIPTHQVLGQVAVGPLIETTIPKPQY